MFEFEVSAFRVDPAAIPESVKEAFEESRKSITSFSILPWEEHCIECAMPACYTTCNLYEPRKDGKCRRFQHGFGLVEFQSPTVDHIAKVAFKRWGSLMAYSNTRQINADRANRVETMWRWFGSVISAVPDSRLSVLGRKGLSARLVRRMKRRSAMHGSSTAALDSKPTSFIAEVYNPGRHRVLLTLVIRDQDPILGRRPFEQLLEVTPGFHRFQIPFSEIAPHLGGESAFSITLGPNLQRPEDDGLELYFGLLTFVIESSGEQYPPDNGAPRAYSPSPAPPGTKHVKVLVWDLDNTLWDGILVEDGVEGIRLRAGVREVIKELDRRGIVSSVVSKNDYAVAWPVVRSFGLDSYLAFPRIGWQPKSQSIMEVIEAFNVGADTVAVIDDSAFERAEISERCQEVRVYTHEQYRDLLLMPEFRPTLSEDSARRRISYKTEELREATRADFASDYESFLRSCEIVAEVRRPNNSNLARVHELVQRTNQLNFSGRRYTLDELEELLARSDTLPVTVQCRDRFGDYGLVGFILVDLVRACVTDLMFSCRVQAKGVERAVLTQIMTRLSKQGADQLGALFKPSPKNGPAKAILEDLGFVLLATDSVSGVEHHSFPFDRGLPISNAVTVVWGEAP